jgi:hypothetical protein
MECSGTALRTMPLASFLARERLLREARNGRGVSRGNDLLKTFIRVSVLNSSPKSCSGVHSVNYVNAVFGFLRFSFIDKECYIFFKWFAF